MNTLTRQAVLGVAVLALLSLVLAAYGSTEPLGAQPALVATRTPSPMAPDQQLAGGEEFLRLTSGHTQLQPRARATSEAGGAGSEDTPDGSRLAPRAPVTE